MLQGRLFGYGDAHRYHFGTNAHFLDVNKPKGVTVNNYGRDGVVALGDNGGRRVNYEPNNFDTAPVRPVNQSTNRFRRLVYLVRTRSTTTRATNSDRPVTSSVSKSRKRRIDLS